MNLKNQVTNSVSSVYLFLLTLVTAGRGAWSAHNDNICGEQNVLGCAESFSKLSNKEEMRLLRTKSDLDRICPELLKSVECIDRYSRLCMIHSQRAHFHHLYRGIAQVVQDLCKDGDYREEFLKHAPCMSEVTEEHEVCSRIHLQKIAEMSGKSAARHARHSHHENEHSDQPHHHDEYPQHNVHHRQHHHHREMPNATEIEEAARAEEIKTLCCSFHDYLRCSHRGVATRCGEETGLFANDFMTRMASKVIEIHCMKDYPADSIHCRDAAASAPALKTSLFSALTTLSSLVLVYNTFLTS